MRAESSNQSTNESRRHPTSPAHRPALLLGALFLTVCLSGCLTVGPDFEAPEPELPAGWLGTDGGRLSSDPISKLEWWTIFQDPVLESLIQQAYAGNPALQIAGLRVYEARAILGKAVGSLYPQVQQATGSVGAFRISKNAEPVANLPDFVRDEVDTSFGNFRLGFDAAWEVDFWGRIRRGVESADANLAATIASYDDALVTLTGDVAGAYMLLRTLEERLSVARSNVALQERSLEIAEVRNRNQLTTELDPQLARALLRDTQSLIPELEAGVRQVKNALAVLLGQLPGALDSTLATGSGIPATPLEVAMGVPSELLRRRPDIRRAELRAAAQSARIGVAKADLYPAFNLAGSIGFAVESLSHGIFDADSRNGFGVAGIRWNILNFGQIRSLVRVEDARFQQLLVAYQNTVLRAAREVQDGAARFGSAHEQVAFLEDGAKASQRAVELSLTQYRDGVADYTRVLDSQRFLLLQQDRLAAARGRAAGGLIAVYKALGGGWEQRTLDSLVPAEMREEMKQRTNWGKLLEEGKIEPVPEDERGRWRLPDFF